MVIFHSWKDLENWVDEHVDPYLDSSSIDALVRRLRFDAKSPHWGQDWSTYLDSLPENLSDLLVDWEKK